MNIVQKIESASLKQLIITAVIVSAVILLYLNKEVIVSKLKPNEY